VSVSFDSEGPRDIWQADQWPISWPSDSKRITGSTTEIEIGDKKRVFIFDVKSGNLATLESAALGPVWKVTSSDFKLIGVVNIKIESKGKPVAAANVKATTGKRVIEQVLDPSQKGQIRLLGVEPGPLNVSVTYRSEGRQMDPLEQTFKVSLKRSSVEPTFTVAISEPVEVVGVEQATGKPSSVAEKSNIKPGNSLFNILATLLFFAGAAALGYYLLQFAKKNPDQLKERLEKMGVQVPDPQSAPDDTSAPVPVPVPQAPQKIVLDQSDVSVAATPGIFDPRLTSDFGLVFRLNEGSSGIGRDASASLSLAEESSVSRSHAEINRQGDNVVIRDLGSTNGTFVNGVKVTGDVTLKGGDTVQFGAVRFRYEV
jgi:hypothetical protein